PDLAAAHGAAILGGMLGGKMAGPTLVDVTIHTIAAEVLAAESRRIPDFGQEGEVGPDFPARVCLAIIPANSALPFRVTALYDFRPGEREPSRLSSELQRKGTIKLYAGGERNPAKNRKLGEIGLKTGNHPQRSGLSLEFSYDANGLFHVRPVQNFGYPGFELKLQGPELEAAFDPDSAVKFDKRPGPGLYLQSPPYRLVAPPAEGPRTGQGPGDGPDPAGPDGRDGRDGPMNHYVRLGLAALNREGDTARGRELAETLSAYRKALASPGTESGTLDDLEPRLLAALD
ncbi:MAG: hypothetical protein LBJ61_10675, partial [Deltaproteobacteria bacterium]|nr:hypothetical protein [Deltaproteobacteria bacterium]